MAFQFQPVGVNSAKPYILVASQRITFVHSDVLKALGDPEYLRVESDPRNQAIRLTKQMGAETRADRKIQREKGEKYNPYINVLLNNSDLPYGYYRPLGGGVFIFDKLKGKNKS